MINPQKYSTNKLSKFPGLVAFQALQKSNVLHRKRACQMFDSCEQDSTYFCTATLLDFQGT